MIRWGTCLANGAWVLRIFYPDGRQGTFSISSGKLQIGADAAQCGLVISGRDVAGRHCSLTERQGRLLLGDNGSAAGTWLNGQKLAEPAELRAGDQLRVGDHVLELVAVRPRIDPALIGHRLRHVPVFAPRSEAEVAEDMLDWLAAHARRWMAAGCPRRGLMRRRDRSRLRAAMQILGRESGALGEALRSWAETSERYRRLRQGAVLSGLVALAVTAAVVQVVRSRDVGDAGEEPAASSTAVGTAPVSAPVPSSRLGQIDHAAIACETLSEVASLYDVQLLDLAEQNQLREDEPLRDGQVLRVRTSRPPIRRWEERRFIEAGETWLDLADQYDVPEQQLRRCNPELRRPLQPGDEVVAWVRMPEESEKDAPRFVPGSDERFGLVPLPVSAHYARRCAMNAFGTPTTIARLVNGLARFRQRTRYGGELVVGDLSRRNGGPYGPHKSHQSGHDVDIWLPVRRKAYARGCRSCGTDFCRPEPDDVDWRTTWQLIQELGRSDEVKVVFIDWALQDRLYRAAREQGVPDAELRRWIQWPKVGTPALVQHADGHQRHMHVRFRCGERELDCKG